MDLIISYGSHLKFQMVHLKRRLILKSIFVYHSCPLRPSRPFLSIFWAK